MAYKVRQTGQQVQADLDKIEGVEAGAQVNVQSDWNESDPDSDAYIKNKPNSISQVQSDWSQSDSAAVDYIKNKPTIPVVPTNVSAFTNDAGYLTQHQDLSSLADGAEYDSNEKKIYLKHGSVRLANPIDATAFIKDGMVDSVDVSNGYLVITFNTDSGKQPISIPLSDIFNANNYYTKSEVDTALGAKQDALTFDSEPTADSDNMVTSGGVYDALQDIDIESVTEVTWAELKGLRDGGNLVKGNFYRITDYNCTTTQENTQSAGHQFDIVLLALSENKLAEEGWVVRNENNLYDVTFSDNVTKKCWIYFDGSHYNIVDDKTQLGDNSLSSGNITLDFSAKTASCPTLSSASLITENLSYNNDYFKNSNLNAWKVWYCLDNDKSRFAWADDTNNKSIIVNNRYEHPAYYVDSIIVKGVGTFYAWVDDEENQYLTANEIPVINEQVFTYSNGQRTELGNVTAYIENPNGRGVIYRLIDEFNNDIKYDFKNIQFLRPITDGQYDEKGEDTWCYTLNLWYNDMCQDASIVGNTLPNDEGSVSGVYDNNFGYVTAYDIYIEGVNTFAFTLGDNVVLSFDNAGYYGIHSNTIGDRFYSNTIGNSFSCNTILNTFNRNTIGNEFYSNKIGNDFYANTIGNGFYFNSIGNGCNSNTIGNNFHSNTVGNDFDGRTISNNTIYKNYGNNGVELVDDNNYVHTDNNYTSAEKTKLAGIASGAEVNVQSDWNQSSSSADDFIKNKPSLASVATSGSYNDLSDKPTIPAAQIQADWNQTTTTAKDYIKNKPTIPAAQVQSNWSESDTSSKAYIQNKPTIPAAQVNADWNASSGAAQILNKPTIPTIPATATQAEVDAGSSTSQRTFTPQLLHDNAYIVETTYTSGSLKANKMYDFGTVSSALTIPSLDASDDLVSNALNFYALRFIAGADNLSITFPTGVIVDDTPTINTGDYVEIMINLYVENNTNHFYASIKVWQAQQ